jgi:hypothetical protein
MSRRTVALPNVFFSATGALHASDKRIAEAGMMTVKHQGED